MILAIYMALCAGYAGGSLPYSHILDRKITVFGREFNLTWLPEALFALPFGLGYGLLFPIPIIWSYLWMQSATAPALHWGKGNYNPERSSTLKPLVDWVNKRTLKADPSTAAYCRLYMGIKWLLICLPAGIFAPVGALFAVLAYEGGAKFKWPHGVTECLTGLGAALSIILGIA